MNHRMLWLDSTGYKAGATTQTITVTTPPNLLGDLRYYDLRRHWTKRIVPHLNDEFLNAILVRNFNKFTWG